METPQKTALSLLLFPLFASPSAQNGFGNLLRTARLVVDERSHHTMPPRDRNRPLSFVHAWIRIQLADWQGPSVIFFWANDGGLLSAVSALETLDEFEPLARMARKVVMVPDDLWTIYALADRFPPVIGSLVHSYRSMDERQAHVVTPVLVMRQKTAFEFEDARALGIFLGTRNRDSQVGMPVVMPGRASKPPREDETIQVRNETPDPVRTRRVSGAVEAQAIRASRPDPRREDEDDRPTIEPPPPSPLPKR